MRSRFALGLLLLSGYYAFAQTIEKEPAAVIELGGANSWNLKGGSSAGGDAAVEFTPIENWLEIEVGVTPLFARHSVEWDTDLLFKKPWTLSERVEFSSGNSRGAGQRWIGRDHFSDQLRCLHVPADRHRLFRRFGGGK